MKTPDGDPSAPSEAVGMSTLIELVGLPERAVPLWIAARAGYSLRFYVDQFAARVWPLDVSLLDRERIIALASAPADDLLDALRAGDDDMHDALDPAAALSAPTPRPSSRPSRPSNPRSGTGCFRWPPTNCNRTSAGSSMSRLPSRFSVSGSCWGRSTRRSGLRHRTTETRHSLGL